MARLSVEIVTIERQVYAGEADVVLAPGIEGQLGVLPRHAPLITRLVEGELVVRSDDRDQAFAIGGGFMEVLPDRVVVLADSAERPDEIDVRRAEAARERAAHLRREQFGRQEAVQTEAALRRSTVRLRVARRRAPSMRRPGEQALPD